MSVEQRAAELGVELLGSLLAVPRERRTAAAHELVAKGHRVHIDLIEGTYRGQAGLEPDELVEWAELRDALDVHLMVDDPVAAITGLPLVPRRITVQIADGEDIVAIADAVRARGADLWLAFERPGPEELQTAHHVGAQGVLVMLTPPGRPGCEADLHRLPPRAVTRHLPLPLGVDGGVTAENLAAIAAAGVDCAVVGRALWGSEESP